MKTKFILLTLCLCCCNMVAKAETTSVKGDLPTEETETTSARYVEMAYDNVIYKIYWHLSSDAPFIISGGNPQYFPITNSQDQYYIWDSVTVSGFIKQQNSNDTIRTILPQITNSHYNQWQDMWMTGGASHQYASWSAPVVGIEGRATYRGSYTSNYSAFDYDYEGRPGITEINIPNSVKWIDSDALANCPDLKIITIPESVERIGNDAFYGCDNLTTINWNARHAMIKETRYDPSCECNHWLEEISTQSLFPNMNVISFGEDVEYIPIYLCPNTEIQSVTIPSKVTEIGEDVFSFCHSLNSVTFLSSLTHIGDNAFSGCEGLTSIEFPSSLTHIGDNAFSGCEGLTSIEFPSSLTHIGSRAFSECSQLTIITLPENVEEIGSGCFSECKNLKEVYIPATCALIDSDHYEYESSPILSSMAIEKITAPAYCFNLPEMYYLYGAKNMQEIHINAGTLDADGWGFIKRSSKTLRKLDLSALENTVMDDEALDECFKLTSLQLPSSCEHIGYKAMAECVMLKSINIPSSVVEIDDRAFEDCRSIESIVFGDAQAANAPNRFNAPATANQLKRIGNWAFYNAHELQNLEIPEGVEEIGDAAFYGCVYLEEMTLPSSVQTIGDNTFALCSKLKKITCNAATPPTIKAKTFYDVKRQIPVYVPEEAVTAYEADTYWQEFDIQGQSKVPSAVEHITNTQSKIVDKIIKDRQILILRGEKVYTITGQEVK